MAWSSPPSFSSGAVLSASALNTVSDDLVFLHGLISGANPAMASIELTVNGTCFAVIRHKHRYLHAVYLCQDDFRIAYSADGATWTEVYHDGAPNGTVADSIPTPVDLNSFGLTVGGLYILKFTMDSGIVYYCYEKDSAGYI